MSDTSKNLNYEQAAERIGVSTGALRALVSRKKVPHLRIGPRSVVFDRGDLDEWLASKRVNMSGETANTVIFPDEELST